MNNELREITKEDLKGATNSEYAKGIRDGVLLVAKTYNIKLSEEFKEKLETLVKIVSSK